MKHRSITTFWDDFLMSSLARTDEGQSKEGAAQLGGTEECLPGPGCGADGRCRDKVGIRVISVYQCNPIPRQTPPKWSQLCGNSLLNQGF